ncbi:DedD protein [Sphaerotilus hippei]|uniref:DedD protein n=1 Tax=Sphaerotilus hippei TaxID=744406 RepID=A0A318HCR3_9BURK|nr:SPOR domain-containing protein [Sphaerotilus hippei]PXW98765.1 DedD protein [Sphaerotilus hippei]
MGLLSFFKRTDGEGRRAARVVPPQDPGTLEALRLRTRRRLIGLSVLVVGAVVAVPMMLEKEPRAPQAVSGTVVDAAAPATGKLARARADAPEVAASVAARAAPQPLGLADSETVVSPAPAAALALREQQDRRKAEQAAADRRAADKLAAERRAAAERREAAQARQQADKRAAERKAAADKLAAEKRAADKEKDREKQAAERRLAERRKAEAKERQEAEARRNERRYIIQVGAYSEDAAVREARRKIDRLGLQSVEQDVNTSSGKRTRVRLGPYSSRAEAERAAAKLRAGGLSAAILAL